MHPVVVAAVLLLVTQTPMSGSAATKRGRRMNRNKLTALQHSLSITVDPEQMCGAQYPAVPCAKSVSKKDGEEWFQMGDGRCVKAFFYTQHLSFDDAEKTCVTYGGHLVSIHNIVELNQLECTMFRMTPGRPPYWIGLKLAVHYKDYLVFDWTDGTDSDFNRFAYLQPDFYQESEECVEINYRFWGHWNDLNCNIPRGYVCAVNI